MHYLTLREIAALHSIPYPTLQVRLRRRNIKHERIGGVILVYKNQVGKLVAPHPTRRLRSHVLYYRWANLVARKRCCKEWRDFETFERDVTPQTGKRLWRLDSTKPYSKNNYKWI